MALILFRSIRQAVLMGRYFAAAKVDLFNPQPIFALSRYSSQSSLAIIVMFYLLFLLSTSSEWETFQEGLLSPIFVTIQFVLIGVGIFLFFMSLGSINRHMRMEKDRLLTMFGKNLEVIYVKTTVAAEKEQFEKVKGFRDAAATMKEGWELVKKLPTWPWEAESLRNMLSPLLIPILVFIIQRFIGSFLGS